MADELEVEKKQSPVAALELAKAEAGKPSLDDMIFAANRAAEKIENDAMRWYEIGLHRDIDPDQIAPAVQLRAGARLLELMKWADQAAVRRLFEAARERIAKSKPAKRDTALAMLAHEAKGDIP